MAATRNSSLRTFLMLVAALLGPGISSSVQPETKEAATDDVKVVVARVNGEPVYEADVLRRLRAVPESEIETAKLNPNRWQMLRDVAIQSEITDKLLLKAAIAAGMALSADEAQRLLKRARKVMGERAFEEMLEQRGADLREHLAERELINRYKEKLFAGIVVEQDVLKEYYRGHKAAFVEPARVRLEVFTLGVREAAEKIYGRWKSGESFDEIAEAYLAEGERVGRRTRWMPVDAVPAELRGRVNEIAAGTILEPVRFADRFYVARVVEKREARTRGFDEVEDEVRETILDLRKSKTLDAWYEVTSRKAKIEYAQ